MKFGKLFIEHKFVYYIVCLRFEFLERKLIVFNFQHSDHNENVHIYFFVFFFNLAAIAEGQQSK